MFHNIKHKAEQWVTNKDVIRIVGVYLAIYPPPRPPPTIRQRCILVIVTARHSCYARISISIAKMARPMFVSAAFLSLHVGSNLLCRYIALK